MLTTFLAWIYISFLCWCWGSMIIRLIARSAGGSSSLHFSIVCFTGFAFITITGAMLSLFLPLGSWLIQLVYLLPLLLVAKRLKRPTFSSIPNPWLKTLLVASLTGILCMSVWYIIHPDTLGYHIQTIKWIGQYKAVPGLVNINTRLGYQGLSFVGCSLFSFKFTGTDAITFINTTILAWYILFLIDRINANLKNGTFYSGMLWLLLLVYGLWNYTHIRLTATSASPDFISILCVLLVLYIICNDEIENATLKWLLVILFTAFAITLKLSAIPLIIAGIYGFIELLRMKQYKHAILSVFCVLLVLTPFVTRNIISSGWATYPSTIIDITATDWKADKETTELEKDYITAYARTKSSDEKSEIRRVLQMPYKEWVPTWWDQRSWADRSLIIVFTLAFIYCLLRSRKILLLPAPIKITLLTAVGGAIFWFTQAPDVRFGAGFLLALPAIALTFLLPGTGLMFPRKYLNAGIIAIVLVVSGYTVYRFVNFFSAKQLLFTAGVAEQKSQKIKCEGIDFYMPVTDEGCGDLPLPCIYDSCRTVQMRGKRIENGFRAKIR